MTSPATPDAPRIFVSHSHADNEYCRAFVRGLRDALGDEDAVWYDEHNLGWGAIRQVIEREIQVRNHFIAIFSPASVVSEWVNAEIDAALFLLGKDKHRTLLFVTAERCDVPLLLQRYKRIERPDGSGYTPIEAVARVLSTIRPIAALPRAYATPTPITPSTPAPQSSRPTPSQQPPTSALTAPAPTSRPPAPILPPDQFPPRFASLSFTAQAATDATGKRIPYILPPLCPVPAGPFLMGSDPHQDAQAQPDEQPAHEVTLPAYQIARYPVAVAEYACFIRSGHAAPGDWATQQGKLDHPVVHVSWQDAVAYAAWLAKLTGQPWRLPTEAEWEKAARWDPQRRASRIYPWGDTFDMARANTGESRKGGTTPVSMYPNGASPCGAEDMAGNIWEWTSSRYQLYPYSSTNGRENRGASTDNRVLRGGSWDVYAINARAAYRSVGGAGSLYGYYGFRLALAAPIS